MSSSATKKPMRRCLANPGILVVDLGQLAIELVLEDGPIATADARDDLAIAVGRADRHRDVVVRNEDLIDGCRTR